MAQDIKAHLRFLPMSAQKVRLVVDTVRGKDANTALETLRFVNKAAAIPVRKLLASAVVGGDRCRRAPVPPRLVDLLRRVVGEV